MAAPTPLKQLPVAEPGIYEMPAAAYHADPCPEPSLSHSVARLVHKRSPLHGKRAHPRFGGQARTATRDMALGSVVHALMLGRGADIVRIDADSYRTKAAQEARDAAQAQGAIPILTSEFEHAELMAAVARHALERFLSASADGFLYEPVAIGLEGTSWRRAMMDTLAGGLWLGLDFKTCECAAPEEFGLRIRKDYATQEAFYRHVLSLIDPAGARTRRFLFMAQERDCPEAITFHETDPALLEIAEGEMKRARELWDESVAAQEWAAYPIGPHPVAPAPWQMNDEMLATEEAA